MEEGRRAAKWTGKFTLREGSVLGEGSGEGRESEDWLCERVSVGRRLLAKVASSDYFFYL